MNATQNIRKDTGSCYCEIYYRALKSYYRALGIYFRTLGNYYRTLEIYYRELRAQSAMLIDN